ncbi:MAG TPA: hypothetical protein VFJ09_12945 [Nocardioidaceae bacterium]|nr:hypothetical protein [Nocardioidaceae bacterium]
MVTDVFAVLANPVRREILTLLRDGPRAVNDLAGRFEAGPLAEVEAWLHPFERFWRTRLRSLRDVLDEERP